MPKTFSCDTAIIQGFFTLDNAKFWYLNFIYNFMYKCLDKTRFHFIEGDTDSMYFAISGNSEEDNNQGFKHIISDENFYNNNVYKFLPSNFYSTTQKPTFQTKLDKQLFDKKLGGLEIEKHCDSMIALAPKMYSCINDKNKPVEIRVKGVSTKVQKKEITPDHYIEAIQDKKVLEGSVNNLQLVKGIMSQIELRKNFITAAHTKYMVSDDFSTCLPLFLY
jgi:DNA polymerase elongation subunit (family B)